MSVQLPSKFHMFETPSNLAVEGGQQQAEEDDSFGFNLDVQELNLVLKL